MKPERVLVAARPAAQHCAALLRRGKQSEDYLLTLHRLGSAMARELATALPALTGGEPPVITASEPRACSEAEYCTNRAALAAHCLLAAGEPGATLVTAIDGAAVLALVDRAFGGSGTAPKQMPRSFPVSAELMIERIEALIVQSLCAALGETEAGMVRVLKREACYGELAPFPAAARLAVMELNIAAAGEAPWTLTIALPLASLPKLLDQRGPGARRRASTARINNADAEPFGSLPLPLTAVLVDMAVPLSALAALRPGSVLPVSIARVVPLLTGATLIARGAVGTEDDRIAIQLTQLA